MRRGLRRALGRFRAGQSGQSLVFIALTMVGVIGISALAIDVSSWYERHHRAQVVADSAALAAANCLANPGSGSTTVNGVSVPACSTDTDTTDAQKLAVAYAGANGLTISNSAVTFSASAGTVTVTATVNAPAFLGRIFGIVTSTQTATATASWRPSRQNPCGSPGSNCDFMFANSTNCSAAALTLQLQGSSVIDGNIVTNGSVNASQVGNSGGISGAGSYGPGTSPACTSTSGAAPPNNKDPWQDGNPTQATGTISWPIDYSQDFPACGASPLAACVNGYPPWCTYANTSFSFTSAPANADSIYCASGTPGNGVLTSDPSTWTGTITFNMSGSNTYTDTFVAGSISYSGTGNDTVTACGFTTTGFTSSTCSAPIPATANYPVFYVTGSDPSGSAALSVGKSNGSLSLNGDIFVPNGTVSGSFGGGQTTYTFIEANAINASMSGNFLGDGPELNGGSSGSVILGGDSLIG